MLLTANQAAEHLGTSRGSLGYRRRKAGIQRHPQAGTRQRQGEEWPFAMFRLADVERLRR
jgi:hypothetical protein